ncbi:uncharacterized protein LOC116343906 [Contarinia nasturtii]|uniref:uncharacterized protein LOC116343906 n=1 Tax=Contarinia nasturtii TaxID=265458 RepID=UPI0012D45BD0|nr:uncharacterized protein LOC116343906 [Contarinia nasturtii]
MYAGVSMGKSIALLVISAASMLAGSNVVHQYYKPLDDLEEYVEREIQNRKSSNS